MIDVISTRTQPQRFEPETKKAATRSGSTDLPGALGQARPDDDRLARHAVPAQQFIPIRIPRRVLWREFRFRLLPGLVWILILAAVILLWRNQIKGFLPDQRSPQTFSSQTQ